MWATHSVPLAQLFPPKIRDVSIADMTNDVLDYSLQDGVAVLRIDDGKANALSRAVIEALQEGLDRAEGEARAVLVSGRPGRLSAGFDLSVMKAGPDAMRALVTAGAEVLLRFYTCPLPTAIACTGHALAAGALLLLVTDMRIGADGDFKIGLNEVAIGMPLPIFGVEFARDRLSKRHFTQAVTQSRIYSPAEAVDAGFLDRLVPPEKLFDEAGAAAAALANLPAAAYAITKRSARVAVSRFIRETLADDIANLTGPR